MTRKIILWILPLFIIILFKHVRWTCPTCQGNRIVAIKLKDCPVCRGMGKEMMIKCGNCKGTGKILDRIISCRSCEGTGKMTIRKWMMN